MNSYLIVKTGKSGATLSNLYSATIKAGGKDIRLCQSRLTGSWYQSIVKASKDKGIKGTLSVLVHNPEDADLLLADNQRSFIALSKGLNWKVVGRIDATEDDLSNASQSGRDAVWKALEEDGTIVVTKRRGGKMSRYNIAECQTEEYKKLDYLTRRSIYKSALKDIKDSVKIGGARAVSDMIQIVA